MAEAGEAASARRSGKSAGAFRTTTEVAKELDLPAHVLRFWESKFPQVSPLRRAGGRRYYRPEDVELLRRIRQCLYQEGYTIRGVQKLLRENGLRGAEAFEIAAAEDEPPPAAPSCLAPSGEALAAVLEEVRRELLAIRALLERLGRS
ncbi:MAG TPA: MerR family transcriptional regulator [Stellaceae bacterium]|nr:MerR family transcriptional regulator [Stellaceae bacterium]